MAQGDEARPRCGSLPSPPQHECQERQREDDVRGGAGAAGGRVVEAAVHLQAGGLDAALAVVAVVGPADELGRPQVLVLQPLLQRPEELPQRRAVEAALARRGVQGLRPRHARALLHQLLEHFAGLLGAVDVALVQL